MDAREPHDGESEPRGFRATNLQRDRWAAPHTRREGAHQCKTYFDDDLVIVLLRGGYTAADKTMFEAGKWLNVREAKQAFQDSIEVQLTEVIERVAGRQVLAFLSASHQQPDLMIEAFLIDEPVAFTAAHPDALSET